MSTPYRNDLPTIPRRMLSRPIERGYPVPWFCAKVGDKWDFRIADPQKLDEAIAFRRCWLCGQPLGGHLAFMIGPMCAINRTTSEPPSHRECAEWAARACPFLTQRESHYRTSQLPDGIVPPAGYGIARQPGVALLWVTKSYRVLHLSDGVLFKIGAPIETRWYREGRAATRAEILASIEGGYPFLLEMAQEENAVGELEAARDQALALIEPKE